MAPQPHKLQFLHLSKRMLESTIPGAPHNSQLTPPLAPLAITAPFLGGEPHTTFDLPMINQVAHLGRLGSLLLASGGFIRDIQQQFRPGALHTRWPTRAWPATHMMDLLSGGILQGGGEEPLSLADHMWLAVLPGTCCDLREHVCTPHNRGLNNKCFDDCMCMEGQLDSGRGERCPQHQCTLNAPGTMKPLLSSQLCNERGMRFPGRGWIWVEGPGKREWAVEAPGS